MFDPVAMAALQASLHSPRVLASNGLVSPDDIDQSIDGVMETLESLSPEAFAIVQKNLDPAFANLKQLAANNWRK